MDYIKDFRYQNEFLEIINTKLDQIISNQNQLPIQIQPEEMFGDTDWLCKIAHIKKPTVYPLVKKNKIPGAIKRGTRILFNKIEVINWIEQQRIVKY